MPKQVRHDRIRFQLRVRGGGKAAPSYPLPKMSIIVMPNLFRHLEIWNETINSNSATSE